MFGDISSDETDHWNPMSSNPIVPEKNVEPFTVDGINDVPNEEDHEDIIHDWAYQEEEEEVKVQYSSYYLRKNFNNS
jgi:hypothetical protein